MGIFDGCLLASDIDGTLLDSGEICPRNLEKIDYFIKQGGILSLSTGRSIEAVGQVFEILDKRLVGHGILLNGGMIYDFAAGKPLFERLLPDSEKQVALRLMEQVPAIGIEVHSGQQVFVLNRSDATDLHEEYERLTPHFVSFDEINDRGWNKVLYTCANEEIRGALRKAGEFVSDGTSAFYDTSAEIGGIPQLYLEQLPSGTSKGDALRRLAELVQVKRGGLFAIGDYYNDESMVCAADIGAVTAGAPEDLKEKANFVSTACRDGAVADFIEYLASLPQPLWEV